MKFPLIYDNIFNMDDKDIKDINFKNLSPSERFAIVDMIMESFREGDSKEEISEDLKKELDQRLVKINSNQEKLINWEECKTKLGL